MDNKKPRFGPAQLWGACSRCNARVAYNTLRRERLTGLLVCTELSGRPVNPCWDPWPEVYDFQLSPDKSIEPPPEPLPLRYNLDSIWGTGNDPKPAPDDATRLARLVRDVPYYKSLGVTAAFPAQPLKVPQQIADVTTIRPSEYDGTFVPSNSVRTVTPPAATVETVEKTDIDVPDDKLWAPPWGVVTGV